MATGRPPWDYYRDQPLAATKAQYDASFAELSAKISGIPTSGCDKEAVRVNSEYDAQIEAMKQRQARINREHAERGGLMRTREEIVAAIEEHEKSGKEDRAEALRWVLGDDLTVRGLKSALKSVGVEKDLTLFVPRGIKVRIYD
jgi:hypothetical protein